jgi:type IV secretory pathway protease TraF
MTRWSIIAAMLFGTGAIAFGSVATVPVRLIWNSSASVPIGLYTVAAAEQLTLSDLVAVRAPTAIENFMVARGYLASGVPLLKRVRALPGQEVCRAGSTITIDGIEMGEALARDRRGRELPRWQGCRTLAEGEIFLMNAAPRQPRRPLLRPVPNPFCHRPDGPALDRRARGRPLSLARPSALNFITTAEARSSP